MRRNPGWWPVLAAWALLGLALLAAAGMLIVFVVLAAVCWLLLATVRQQLAPSRYNRPSVPEPYRLADDPAVPLAEVVTVAEQEAGRQ